MEEYKAFALLSVIFQNCMNRSYFPEAGRVSKSWKRVQAFFFSQVNEVPPEDFYDLWWNFAYLGDFSSSSPLTGKTAVHPGGRFMQRKGKDPTSTENPSVPFQGWPFHVMYCGAWKSCRICEIWTWILFRFRLIDTWILCINHGKTRLNCW